MDRRQWYCVGLVVAMGATSCIRDPDSFEWAGEWPDGGIDALLNQYHGDGDGGGDPDVAVPEDGFQSCQDVVDHLGPVSSGVYPIAVAGEELQIYCDFSADGGVGYSLYEVESADLQGDPLAYQAACDELGLDLVVPRTRAHLKAIQGFHGAVPAVVGVYPRGTAAGVRLHHWEGRCEGQGCDFYLDDGDVGCLQERQGEADLFRPLARVGEGCEFGQWGQGEVGEEYRGRVVCSLNRGGPEVAESCWEYRVGDTVHNAGPDGISGVYQLRGEEGANYQAYCDMTTAGGGWTLAMKVDGEAETFRYDADLWTSGSVFQSSAPDLDRTEAKLRSFLEMPATQVLVKMEAAGGELPARPAFQSLVLGVKVDSLRGAFQSGEAIGAGPGSDSWVDLLPAGALQRGQESAGLNQRFGAEAEETRVRIGILGGPAEGSYESFVGIGASGIACGQQTPVAGNTSFGCESVPGDTNRAAFTAVLLRDVPVRESCQAHREAGVARSGIYEVQAPGDEVRTVYCEMELAGGGWTLAVLFGQEERPVRFSGEYPRPGGSEYGSWVLLMTSVEALQTPGDAEQVRRHLSVEAREVFAASGREFLAFVGGNTQDYIRGRLPGTCNFFDPDVSCSQDSEFFSVFDSEGEVLLDEVRACTNGRHVPGFEDDQFNEFGLHLLHGPVDPDVDTFYCAAGLGGGAEPWSRVFTTFEGGTDPQFWSRGVLHHWGQDTENNGQPGMLLIR